MTLLSEFLILFLRVSVFLWLNFFDRERFDVPVAAYNVSAEYYMVKAATKNGWIDEQRIVMEIMTSIQRAGASIVLTCHAKDVARWLGRC